MSKFDKIMNFFPGNVFAYNQLLKRLKDNRIVPFIGAGLSAFCYPSWEQLLNDMLSSVPESNAKIAKTQISSFDYLAAADTLCDAMGELLFYEYFRNAFNESIIDEKQLKNQAVYLLPKFQFTTYVTTNYDRVLENALSLNGILYEVGFPYDTYRLASYMRDSLSNPMVLKIHGDIRSDKDNLILTGKSYESHYADGECLKEQLSKWAESKNFLFLGASLYKDKTVSVIADRMQEGMINYAIMGVDSSDISTVRDRITNVNAIPIFYDKNDHSNLTVILQHLLDNLI